METATAHILYPSVFFLDTYMWFFKKNEIILLKKKRNSLWIQMKPGFFYGPTLA